MLSILHVDMNAFYASCHQAQDVSLKGKPLLVAGDPKKRSGIVLTASYEAREYGVKTAMPNWQARKLCPKAVFVKPDYQLYAKNSKKVMNILRQYTPTVEVFSIDEAWLDVKGCENLFGDSLQIAQKIQERIKKELDLSCSIGIAKNKLLAKMASDLKKPMGITVINDEDIEKVIWPMPVEKLFGVGRKMAKRLKNMNINTIGELAQISPDFLKQNYGINGEYLYRWANGIDKSFVDPHSRDEAKSIGNSTTLPVDVVSYEDARMVLLFLSEEVGRRVRKDNYMGRSVTITLRDNKFNTITRSSTIPYTCNTDDIYETAKELLHSHWDGKTPLRLLGVSLSQLTQEAHQISLFEEDEKKRKLNKTIDEIKNRFGEGAIFRAKLLEDTKLNKRNLGK